MATKVYKVPAKFYGDHIGRDCGVTDRIIETKKNYFVVELDEVGYKDLLSDADYYWYCRDELDMSLCKSAKRTLDYLIKAGGPSVSY